MFANKSSSSGDIEIGRFSYSHNRFLVLLACVAALAYVVADSVGMPTSSGAIGISKLATPQMIWAILLIPLGGFGTWALKRSGHQDSAISCSLITISFLLGAGVRTYLM